MGRQLKQTVLAGGVIYPAGTPATVELEDKIPAKFWDGDPIPTPTGDHDENGKGYDDWKVADLKAEIVKRNEDRDEDDWLSTEGNKADLVAVLKSDDQASED